MKILIDMNISPRWVDVFSIHNIEAVHWSSVGCAYASDIEIMAYAKANTVEIEIGALITIDIKRTRLRILPLF